MFALEEILKTLEYYDRYRQLSQHLSLLEGQLNFSSFPDPALIAEYENCKKEQQEIKDHLNNYIPYPLSARNHYRALEEQEFLFYRCIKGLTMSKTAELMCVSRDTVYRIRRRIADREGWQADFSEDP
jgi:hypothetical protein